MRCTGLGSFGCKVDYILTPVYPQHKALTGYEIIGNALKARIAVNVRAIGIVANTLMVAQPGSLEILWTVKQLANTQSNQHRKNCKTLPREHLIVCQGVKMFLLKDP